MLNFPLLKLRETAGFSRWLLLINAYIYIFWRLLAHLLACCSVFLFGYTQNEEFLFFLNKKSDRYVVETRLVLYLHFYAVYANGK